MNNEKKTDRRDLQRRIHKGELHQEIEATCEKLRHQSEYDYLNHEDGRFALLCWALEQSANGTVGTSLTLAGAFRALKQLRDEA